MAHAIGRHALDGNDHEIAPEQPDLAKRRPPEEGAAFNEVETTIHARRSVRTYRSKQVPEYLVRRVLEAGRFAPSAGNTQSWRFLVVRDPALLADMTSFITDRIGKASSYLDFTRPGTKAIRWLTEFLMVRRPQELHPTPLAGFSAIADGTLGIFHGAPTVIFILYDERGAGSPMLDAGIAGQNMCLTAHSMGLGTCWVSFAKVLEYSPRFKRALDIRHPYHIASTLALGYPRGMPDGFVQREKSQSLWIDEGGERRQVE